MMSALARMSFHIAFFLVFFILPNISLARSISFDWRKELRLAERQLSSSTALTRNNCERVILAWTDRLVEVPSAELMSTNERETADVLAHGSELLHRFFHVRQLLKQRWNTLAAPSEACEKAMRRALRFSRFAEDFFAEWLYSHGAFKDLPQTMFGGGSPHMFVASSAIPFQIEAGDILLMRGPNFRSSFLARAGDEEGDFSHLAIVARNERGDRYIVEALVPGGTVVVPLSDYLQQKQESRVTVLRYRDRSVADRAGLEIFRRTRGVLLGSDVIPYNFSFNLSDETRFYCAQVASYAYSQATNGKLSLPEFRTRLNKFSDSSLFRTLNMHRDEIFAPSDMQLEQGFEIVAEFRNPSLLQKTRYANVAMAQLMALLREGYELSPDLVDLATAKVVVWMISRGQDDSPLSPEGAALLLKAEELFDSLLADVTAIDAQASREIGHPLTFRELQVELNKQSPSYQSHRASAPR
jgi:hypothetical protein